MFALQVDESIDISGKAQLLGFVHMIVDDDNSKKFFVVKHCPKQREVNMFLKFSTNIYHQ